MASVKPDDGLHEYFGNIHMHTTHSDGSGSFDELIAGAVQGGLDFVFVTDHNVLVREEEEGYRRGVLTLVGQEVHDTEREVPGNHMLCLGVEADVSDQAKDPQQLIDAVRQQNALAFLAHPIEQSTRLFSSTYPWHNWEVTGHCGIELWNYLSSFRGFTTSYARALLVAFFPHRFTVGPLPEMLSKWDELTQERPVVALGGTDVHAVVYRKGPIARRFMTYEECAEALNTHVLTAVPFRGQPEGGETDFRHQNVQHDRELILDGLRQGHCWIGYDQAGPTKGFRFWAEAEAGASASSQQDAKSGSAANGRPTAIMGETVALPPRRALRLHVRTPDHAQVRLLRNGRVVAHGYTNALFYDVRDPGVYRVEVWKQRWGKLRGWVFSNPIYVRRAEDE